MKKLIILSLILIGCGNNTTTNLDHQKIKSFQKRQIENTQALRDEIIIDWMSRPDLVMALNHIIKHNHYVTWKRDIEDYFRTYDEFVKNKYYGDCEDISAYYYEIIRREEIIPDMGLFFRWIIKPNDEGHTVLIIAHPDGEIVIDNGKIFGGIKYKKIVAEWDLWNIFS